MNSSDLNFSIHIDELLKRIANILFLNSGLINNLGLLNGKMGIAVFFYHYSRYSENKNFDNFAGELLNEIYAEINTNTPVSFADGLTGIGWGIQYLVKNKFVDADITEVLSEIDVALYQIRHKTQVLINNQDHFFNFGHYFIERLNNLKSEKEKKESFIKKNNPSFIIHECERYILQGEFLKRIQTDAAIDQLNSLIWFLLEAERFNFYPVKSRNILKCLLGNIEEIQIEPALSSKLELLIDLLKKSVDSSSDMIVFEKLKKSLEKHKKTGIKNKTEYLIKNTCQKIIYGDYCRKMELNFPLAELLCEMNKDNFWKYFLDNFKNDHLSLTGIGGLGLGLIHNTLITNKVNHVHI